MQQLHGCFFVQTWFLNMSRNSENVFTFDTCKGGWKWTGSCSTYVCIVTHNTNVSSNNPKQTNKRKVRGCSPFPVIQMFVFCHEDFCVVDLDSGSHLGSLLLSRCSDGTRGMVHPGVPRLTVSIHRGLLRSFLRRNLRNLSSEDPLFPS